MKKYILAEQIENYRKGYENDFQIEGDADSDNYEPLYDGTSGAEATMPPPVMGHTNYFNFFNMFCLFLRLFQQN